MSKMYCHLAESRREWAAHDWAEGRFRQQELAEGRAHGPDLSTPISSAHAEIATDTKQRVAPAAGVEHPPAATSPDVPQIVILESEWELVEQPDEK